MKRRRFFTNTALGAMGTAALGACSDRPDKSANEPVNKSDIKTPDESGQPNNISANFRSIN